MSRITARAAAEQSGVPFTVIYRFLRGNEITSGTFDALSAWVEQSIKAES